MLEFTDIVLQKRRFLLVALAFSIDLLLVSLLNPMLQAHRASIAARIHTPYASQVSPYASSNAVTNGLAELSDDFGRAGNAIEVNVLVAVVSSAATVTRVNRAVEHGTVAAGRATVHGIGWSITSIVYGIGSGVAYAGHTIGHGTASIIRGVGHGFASVGHMFGTIFGIIPKLTHIGSLIHPAVTTSTPVIVSRLRAQQAATIQSGTKSVVIASLVSGHGGACDNGNENGGYPAAWCNAPMDAVATIPYSNDRINRECTSYAYWYFTSVEGHTSFHATGDAKYWAETSNYATHAAPAVGAIAVETAGAYGHVAIVQALPGQKYAGQAVPAGYVLVSEMNYDWNGHFRYSYSPLSKFSAYIY